MASHQQIDDIVRMLNAVRLVCGIVKVTVPSLVGKSIVVGGAGCLHMGHKPINPESDDPV
jgi:hypothetical protein